MEPSSCSHATANISDNTVWSWEENLKMSYPCIKYILMLSRDTQHALGFSRPQQSYGVQRCKIMNRWGKWCWSLPLLYYWNLYTSIVFPSTNDYWVLFHFSEKPYSEGFFFFSSHTDIETFSQIGKVLKFFSYSLWFSVSCHAENPQRDFLPTSKISCLSTKKVHASFNSFP